MSRSKRKGRETLSTRNTKSEYTGTSTSDGYRERSLKVEVLNHSNTATLSDTGPHGMVTPTINLFLLLRHNCNFANVVNPNVSACVFLMVLGYFCERTFNQPKNG